MNDILERLKSATGPDRELDADIDVALFGGETVWKTANYTMEQYPGSKRKSSAHIGGYAVEHVPEYTASIDAALALVERLLPGSGYMITRGRLSPEEPMFGVQLYRTDLISDDAEPDAYGLPSESNSLPLAILAALFTALAKESTNADK